MKVVIVAGGTGGHIYPGLAVAEALKEKRAEILFIGGQRGLEGKLISREGFEIKFIHARGFIRRFSLEPMLALYETFLGFIQSLSILRFFKPDIVLSTGGYVSLPVILAARFAQVPIIIHEQNIIPGLTNRLAGRWAKRITLAWAETSKYFPKDKVAVTGNPIRKKILEIGRKLDPDKKTVLILGGSQGARRINQAAIEMLPILNKGNVKVIHLTGERDYSWVSERVRSVQNYEAIPYLFDPSLALASANLVVSRAGATIISEILAKGIPSILIPFPYAAEGHQEKNAKLLERAGAAVVVKDSELSGERLAREVNRLLSDEEGLKKMSEVSRHLGKPEATQKLVQVLYEVASFSPSAKSKSTRSSVPPSA